MKNKVARTEQVFDFAGAPCTTKRRFALFVLPLVLTACTTGSLFDSDTPVPQSYVLAALPAAAESETPLAVDLSIGRPDLAAGLDSDRIAVLKGRQLDYYRGVRWGTRLIELVQNLIVDSLEDQHLFRSVTAEQARVSGDYVLDIEVRDFQAEYTEDRNAPTVHVSLVGRLIRVVDRELVATVAANAHQPAADNRMSAVTAAFESAAHEAIANLAQQTASVVTSDKPLLSTARGDVAEDDR